MFLARSCSLMHDISKPHGLLTFHGPCVYSDTELDMIISWAIMYSNCNTFLIFVPIRIGAWVGGVQKILALLFNWMIPFRDPSPNKDLSSSHEREWDI